MFSCRKCFAGYGCWKRTQGYAVKPMRGRHATTSEAEGQSGLGGVDKPGCLGAGCRMPAAADLPAARTWGMPHHGRHRGFPGESRAPRLAEQHQPHVRALRPRLHVRDLAQHPCTTIPPASPTAFFKTTCCTISLIAHVARLLQHRDHRDQPHRWLNCPASRLPGEAWPGGITSSQLSNIASPRLPHHVLVGAALAAQ